MHLSKAVDLFLAEHIASTRRTYMYTLYELRDFIGPARPLDKIGPEHLLEYAASLRDRPTLKSAASFNKHIKTARTFFNWCIRVRLLTESPAAGLRLRPTPDEVDRAKAMPDEAFARLVTYCAALEITRTDHRPLALVLYLGDTGGRIGGAAGLRWEAVDLMLRVAVVTEKGRPPRNVYFGPDCADALKRWRLHQRQTDTFVFSSTGAPIKPPHLGQYFRRLCLAAGIGSWGPHSLRHRKGYQLTDARVSPAIAAQVLGDSVDIFLKHYTPKDEGRVREAVEELAFKEGSTVPSKIRRFGA